MNLIKKLFMKQDKKVNEEQIEKQYIFVELDLEHWYEPFYARDLSKTSFDSHEKGKYMHAQQSFTSGASVLPIIASDTSIELLIQTDYFDAVDVIKASIVVRHVSSTFDAIVLEAVFWKRDNSVETIPFKLNVRQDDEKSRLTSALLSIQKEIPFYFGRVEDGVFTIDKHLLVYMPESVQNDMQITLVELYNDVTRKTGPYLELESVSEREMTTAGWVMHFDDEKLKEEDLDLSLIKIEIFRTVFDKIIRLSSRGHFTGWIAERVGDRNGTGPNGETTTFVITSSEQIHMNEKLHSEVMDYMKSLKGFIREDGGYPLKYEALPLLRQKGKQYSFVSVDEDFLTKADKLYSKMTNKELNLYNKLLKMNAAT